MGMWDKDKAFGGTRLDHWIDDGVPFIVWDARIVASDVPTSVGLARKTELTVSTIEHPELCENVGTLGSAIADKVEVAEPGDFPAIVKTETVMGSYGRDAKVLTYVRPYVQEVAVAWKDSGEIYIDKPSPKQKDKEKANA